MTGPDTKGGRSIAPSGGGRYEGRLGSLALKFRSNASGGLVDASAVQAQNSVGQREGGGAMRDEQHRAIAERVLGQREKFLLPGRIEH